MGAGLAWKPLPVSVMTCAMLRTPVIGSTAVMTGAGSFTTVMPLLEPTRLQWSAPLRAFTLT